MFVSQRLWLCDGEQPPPNAARQALDIVQGDDAAGRQTMGVLYGFRRRLRSPRDAANGHSASVGYY